MSDDDILYVNLQNRPVDVFKPTGQRQMIRPLSELTGGSKGMAGGVYVVEDAHYEQFVGKMGPLYKMARHLVEQKTGGNFRTPDDQGQIETPVGHSAKSALDDTKTQAAALNAEAATKAPLPAMSQEEKEIRQDSVALGISTDLSLTDQLAAQNAARSAKTSEETGETSERPPPPGVVPGGKLTKDGVVAADEDAGLIDENGDEAEEETEDEPDETEEPEETDAPDEDDEPEEPADEETEEEEEEEAAPPPPPPPAKTSKKAKAKKVKKKKRKRS